MAFFPMLSGNAGARTKKRSHIFLAAFAATLVQTLLAGPALAQVNRDQWMGDLADDPRYAVDSPMDQTLAEFIFPGTSNSGSYGTKVLPACDSCRKEPLRFYTDTPLLGIVAGLFLEDWAITQTANIEGQLSLGARVLDLRFFRVTPADNQNMQGFVDLLISLGIGDIIALPATDGYYTHNTFAGPSSTEVFQHVRNFLVDGTGVPIPGREQEIIILNFSEMLKGNGEMTAGDLNAIFDQLINTVVGEQYFAESSLTDSATLADLQVAGKQIIVSYDGPIAILDLDPAIQPYIWPKIVGQGFDDINLPGTSFPKADTWNTEGRLFGWMETLALERVNLNATSQLFQMNVSMGADDGSDFPDMVSRRLLCNLPTVYSDVRAYYDPFDLLKDLLGIKSPPAGTTDPTEFEQLIETLLDTVEDSIKGALGLAAFEAVMDDVLGICPAINDDWDRFTSLEEVAGFTNPKLLPSLVGLPRDTVNIVLVDHYPGEFTDEVNKLNQGATRVSVVITKVEERECHDCVPFTALRLSNPDYYPEITFFPKNVSGSIVPDVWDYYESPVDVVEASTPDFGIFQEAILPPNLSEAGMTQHQSHWGGPWLETSGTRITPTWRAFRALSPDTPQVDVKIRIWDQDNNICFSVAPLYTWCGWDDLSRIDGSSTSVTETVESWVGTQPKTDDADPTVLAKPVSNVVGGPFTNCSLDDLTSWPPTCSINLDSSVVHYSVYSCLWAPVPGEDYQFFACDPPSANAAPIAVVEVPAETQDEGLFLMVSGRGSSDPNDCAPVGHPDFSSGCQDYDLLGKWIGGVVEYEWDCNHDPVPVCLNDAIPDDYNPTGGSACPIGYTETSFVPGRGCRKSRILWEQHRWCEDLPQPCFLPEIPSKIRFAAYDGPAEQQVALRVTDRGGKKSLLSDPDPLFVVPVASFQVDNQPPGCRAIGSCADDFEVTQKPGTTLVTLSLSFRDSGADDSPFNCRVRIGDESGNLDVQVALNEVERESDFADDAAGLSLVAYTCKLNDVSLAPGDWTFDPSVQDKDGATNLWPTRTFTVLPPAVTNAGDSGAGSLRDAIANASPGDVLGFDLSLSGQTITLTGGPIELDEDVTIDASALPGGLTISGNNTSGVFEQWVGLQKVTLKGLTIRDGFSNYGGCIVKYGGGLMEILDSTITGCVSTTRGGAIANDSGDNGFLLIVNTTITGNQANQAGAINVFSLSHTEIRHSTIVGNSAVQVAGIGGIIHNNTGCNNDGGVCLQIENSIIAGNTHTLPSASSADIQVNTPLSQVVVSGTNLIGDNLGINSVFPAGLLIGTNADKLDPLLHPLKDSGGPTPTMLPRTGSLAINLAETFVDSPTHDQRGFLRLVDGYSDLGAVEKQAFDVDDNDDDGFGNPTDNCVNIANPDQLDFDSDGDGDVCDATATITILGDGSSGSLRDVIDFVPSGVVIDFDPTASGGSIVLTGGDLVVDKELTIDASSLPLGLTLSGNNASRVFDVTAIGNLTLNGLTIRDGQADIGGCIKNTGGVLDIVDSTVTGCSADLGGGIASTNFGSMTMTNSTVSGNDQVGWGAIFIQGGSATLVHSTISDNHSLDALSSAAGGIGILGVLNIENSIVAGNTGGVTPDIRAGGSTINAFGSNLVGDNSGVTTEFPAGPLAGTSGAPLNPQLNVLGNYGGQTPTMTPIVGSPAVDAAVATGNTPGADQRGVVRPQGVGNDLGAVERQLSDVDVDTDADTVPDVIDNCPADANTNQRDTDSDGIGDVCDVLLTVVPLPDISSDGIEDVAVMREGSILAEIRSGANGALQKNITFLNDNFTPIKAAALPDSDGNGVAELAVLAVRNSDGRIIVEIRNITGAEVPRSIWFAANHTAVDIAVVDDDADDNGVVELAVLSRRNSDGRGLVEVKNAFGATNPVALWAGPGMTSSHVEVLGDKDANGIPEIAILSTRDSDGFIVAEIKNAAGAAMPTAVWFAQGHTAIDMTAVDDKDGNGIPEVAVLTRRNSDGRNVVEVKNAAGPTAPSAVWLAGGFTALAVDQVHDADNNGVPEVAALSVRDSDGRVLVEVKNAFGPTNVNSVWYSPGYAAMGLAILGDTDSNGAEESLVLMIRDTDGRILVQGRNTAGNAAPKQYWFSP